MSVCRQARMPDLPPSVEFFSQAVKDYSVTALMSTL